MDIKDFLSFLHSNGLIHINRITEDSEEGFITRLKIQKYVYIAKYYGLNLNYEYDMYIYGPYSTKLAEDYYNIADVIKDDYSTTKYIIPAEFNADKFLMDMKDKTAEWLEIATTLLDIYDKYNDKVKTIRHVFKIKNSSYDYVYGVYEDLERLSLLSTA